jgi:hypothetical protein
MINTVTLMKITSVTCSGYLYNKQLITMNVRFLGNWCMARMGLIVPMRVAWSNLLKFSWDIFNCWIIKLACTRTAILFILGERATIGRLRLQWCVSCCGLQTPSRSALHATTVTLFIWLGWQHKPTVPNSQRVVLDNHRINFDCPKITFHFAIYI